MLGWYLKIEPFKCPPKNISQDIKSDIVGDHAMSPQTDARTQKDIQERTPTTVATSDTKGVFCETYYIIFIFNNYLNKVKTVRYKNCLLSRIHCSLIVSSVL